MTLSKTALPYDMAPAPHRRRRVTPPIDLGQFDESYEGFKVVIDLEMEMSVQDIITRMSDESISDSERTEATREFLSRALVAWNFTEPVDGTADDVIILPQPRDGGVNRLKIAQLAAISKAIGVAMAPDPNSKAK